ncbi:MAG: hypothetical protein Q8Q62_13970 [Mesorhizobium sp.]|nr:hypothetical protein [Mesorhizobium sp.]
MTKESNTDTTRRLFLTALLLMLPTLALFRNVHVIEKDDLVEVDGWILKRSDLA